MSTILYPLLVFCIRAYKSLETRFLRLIHGRVEKIVKEKFRKLGITLNGTNACDPQIKNKEFYIKAASDWTLGIGEAYMDGMWECEAVDELTYKVFDSWLTRKKSNTRFTTRILKYLRFHFFNLQTKAKVWEVGKIHYDLGNEVFEACLDPNMNYSCGYWRNADNLKQAQLNKMDLIARKLMLKPGMRVLDIGCGWGGLSKYLAQNYKVEVVGCTISKEQVKYAQNFCGNLPVVIRLQDYRDLDEKFDRIVSVGMFEHVGPSNYQTFFQVANRCLKDDGLFLLHTIGVSHPKVLLVEPWLDKYIFPNGILPYHKDIPTYIDGLFVLEDWHNLGYDYSKTLMAWHENFIKAWPNTLSHMGERFFRMWKYYLLTCAGAFRARKIQLWQVVLSKNGFKGGYESLR